MHQSYKMQILLDVSLIKKVFPWSCGVVPQGSQSNQNHVCAAQKLTEWYLFFRQKKKQSLQQESDTKHFGGSVHGKQVKPELDTNGSMQIPLEVHVSMLLQVLLAQCQRECSKISAFLYEWKMLQVYILSSCK